jgi:hypothetical protein
MRIRSVLSHSTQAILEGALIATLVVGLMAGTAFAGRGSGGKPGGGGGTLPLVMVTDANINGAPNYRDDITFDVPSGSTNDLTVGVRCWQGTNFVYDGYVGYYVGAWFDPYFTLDGMYWNSTLDASCTARLFYYSNRGTERIVNTTAFVVAP